MKLQKQLSRKVGEKEYPKWVIIVPPKKNRRSRMGGRRISRERGQQPRVNHTKREPNESGKAKGGSTKSLENPKEE